MGKDASSGRSKHAGKAPAAARTDDTPCETGHAHPQVKELLAGITDPFEIAVLIHQSPSFDVDLVAYLREHRSADYVAAVMEQLVWVQAHFENTRTDHADVPWRDQLATGADTSDPSAPPPARPLPFDKAGGWDAVKINRALGQHDQLTETDSDSSRCAFATALAAQIFLGPAATVAWIEGFIAEHPQAKATFDRTDAADSVLRRVGRAIAARTATYGDLSWAQEALHGMAIAGEHDGVSNASEVIVYGREEFRSESDASFESRGTEVTTVDEVLARAEALAPGERLMMFSLVVPLATGVPFGHQFMIMNHGGVRYVYDPENSSLYSHLVVAGDKTVARYLSQDDQVARLYVQGVAAPKPPTKAAGAT